jgi:predicted transglutaminase-like cysteine proteinase
MKLLLTIIAAFIVALLPAGAIAAGNANGWFVDSGRAEKVVLGSPMLAPTAQIRFCLKRPHDCPNENDEIQPPDWELTAERFIDLASVNREVNAAIAPVTGVTKVTQEWKIAPQSGNCHDYAVTKRHELLSRAWPSRSLLLAEVIVRSGEHHLVLVVRTRTVDLVLDNLTPFLRPVGAAIKDYEWLRIESPNNSLLWSTVITPSSMHVTTAKHYR